MMFRNGTLYTLAVLTIAGCGGGAKSVPMGTADPGLMPAEAGPMVHSDQEVNFGKSLDASARVPATTVPHP
jgi:hypothetical protein